MTATRVARLAAMTLVLMAIAAPARAGWCRFTTVPALTFPPYDVFSPNAVYVSGGLTFDCNKDYSVTITFDVGLGGSYWPRKMLGGIGNPDWLSYNLYTDATYTAIWGDGTNGTQSYSRVIQTDTLQVYGRIPAGQDVNAGPYSDTVTVTINF